jgi:putative lipoic acid-binding regulatory protein
MGLHTEVFVEAMVAIARSHDPAFDPQVHVEQRPSRSGTYLGLTVTVMATNRAQLDTLYRAFTSHPLVKYVL